ncbi:MAG: hypothetical protein ACI9TV_001827 [Sulfurimonas sp.]|jgi:hypothetical protein|uniref:hypothetical protein n=1 Tax=Sulfurimonas sp. TaxID=2022749 RepID=UPI0039E3F367
MKEAVQQQFDIPLHDIKPIVEVQEYSLYYLIGLVGLALIVFFVVVYFLYLWYKKRSEFNLRKHHIKLLFELDFSDTKHTAYAISSYGITFKDDSPRHVEMFNNISERLELYKYRKSVSEFDEETLGYIEVYKGMLDA